MQLNQNIKQVLDWPMPRLMTVALRLTGMGEGPRTHAIEATLQAIDGMNRGLKCDLIQFDPYMMWSLKPFSGKDDDWVGERGLMNGPFAMFDHSDTKPVRVLVLATSTMVWGRPTLFRRMRAHVENKRSDIQLINASVPGYTSLQLLYQLDRLFPFYKPTHIFSSAAWTDSWPRNLLEDTIMMRIMREETWRGGPVMDKLGRAAIYTRFRLRHDGARVPLKLYRRNWRRIVRYCLARNCQPAFFYYPVDFSLLPLKRLLRSHQLPWLEQRYEKYKLAFKTIAGEHPFCDCSCEIEGGAEQYYETDGQHLNDAGMDHAAWLMSEFICREFK